MAVGAFVLPVELELLDIGLGEAVITGLVVASVIATRPDLVHGARPLVDERELEIRKAVHR